MRTSIDALCDAGVRTALFYPLAYASLQTTVGQPVQLRRAKAQAYLMDNAPLAVHPYELLAGSMAGMCPVAADIPTYGEQRREAVRILDAYLEKKRGKSPEQARDRGKIKTFEAEFTSKKSRWALMSRVNHDANITYGDLQQLIAEMEARYADTEDLEKYEIGRELERGLKLRYDPDAKKAVDSLPWFAANHLSLNYGRVVETGLGAVVRFIDDALDGCRDPEKLEYYTAAKLVAGAAVRFILRCAETLERESKSHEPGRARELMEMAVICRKIATQRAETFREGVQLVWLLHIIASIEWSSALSFGRFDQYMGELYKRDLEKGVLTQEQAKELLCCMWLKVNEPRMRTVQSLTIGGVTPEGGDAVNALTALCLEVVREMKLPYPNVGVRVNKKNPPWLLDSVVESIRDCGGQPMIMNDDVWIQGLKKLGYADKYANDYYNMGCVEIMIPGKQPNWGVTDAIAFPMLFESLFEKYRGGQLSLDTFEDFMGAYKEELKAAILADKEEADSKIRDIPGKCYDPFASLLVDGCLESGRDMLQGGSELGMHWAFYAYGLGTAADSMAAIQKFIYQEQRYTMEEMSEALAENFRGREQMRAVLDSKTPSYGNDLDMVDSLAREILSFYTETVLALNSDSRDKYVSTLFGYFFHIYHGEITGATPNGRRKGEPFSDSIGPAQGKDVNGPTKMLNSVLKLDPSQITGGCALNIKINPDLVKSQAGCAALKALIQSYIQDGGSQVQFNFVDAEQLKKAKAEPQKYRNLIVRVGGYCEYFVNLDAALQDEIITRTIHGI